MQQELLQHLATFVGFHSVSDRTEEKERALQWVEETFLFTSHAAVHRGAVSGAPYVYLEHPHPDFLWFAHVDVVPGSPEQFTMRIEGGRAYGRGTKDMKGGAVPFLLAYKHLTEEGIQPRTSILLTSDEETAGPTIPHLLDRGVLHTPVAFTPDTGSKPGIITEHKGVVWAELKAKGSGGHASSPWESKNPIWVLNSALQVLRDTFPPGCESDWRVTVVPTTLAGSNARNQIPEEVTCGIDIRFPLSECSSAKEALALVRKVLPADCELHEVRSAGPLLTDANHPMVQMVKSLAEESEGRSVEIIREHGGTDARYFCERGIPAFLYGPVGGNIHARDEWVSIPSLLKQYEISRKLLQTLA
ncbi:MAG: Peptidase M20 [Candidatus Peribacteria bacterium GW2011_GWC2_54_8]|nr:MAG: Peptidase M20 [Candidatus Peribacteria bacterium GW2011_GWC2_54_8]